MIDPLENTDYAAEIHDKAFELVSADVELSKYYKAFRLSPLLAIDPDNLPNLSVYLLRDAARAEGDENAGPPSLVHNVHLGFSGGILANTDDKHLKRLRATMWRIKNLLLRHTEFIALIEGVVSMETRYVFSKIGEMPLSEFQMELVVSFRTDWEPDVQNDFKGVTIRGTPWPNPALANPVVRSFLTVDPEE